MKAAAVMRFRVPLGTNTVISNSFSLKQNSDLEKVKFSDNPQNTDGGSGSSDRIGAMQTEIDVRKPPKILRREPSISRYDFGLKHINLRVEKSLSSLSRFTVESS